jgi:hypothetical protein
VAFTDTLSVQAVAKKRKQSFISNSTFILEFGIWNLEFGIWNLGFGIWNLQIKIFVLAIQFP